MATAPGNHKTYPRETIPVYTCRPGESAAALLLLASELDVAERPGLLLLLQARLLPGDGSRGLELLLRVAARLLLQPRAGRGPRLPAHSSQGRDNILSQTRKMNGLFEQKLAGKC